MYRVATCLFGVKLAAYPGSLVHRARNLLNSLPSDRDAHEVHAPAQRAVARRREGLQRNCGGVRFGGLWSGPVSVKWKAAPWEGLAELQAEGGDSCLSLARFVHVALFLPFSFSFVFVS